MAAARGWDNRRRLPDRFGDMCQAPFALGCALAVGVGAHELLHGSQQFADQFLVDGVVQVGMADQYADLHQGRGVDVDQLTFHTEGSHGIGLAAWACGEVADQVQPQLAAEGLGRGVQVRRRRDRERRAFGHECHSAGRFVGIRVGASHGNYTRMTRRDSLAVRADRVLESKAGSHHLGRNRR